MRVKIVLLLAAIAVLSPFILKKETGNIVRINIGDGIFDVRIAQTQAERARGLGSVRALAANEGMLFEFPQNGLHAIWMKDMLIPIDIIWLSDALSVIDLRRDVSPDTFPAIFAPHTAARFVVELSAGSVKAFDIKIGSRAEFSEE